MIGAPASRPPKAADISDERMLAVVREVRQKYVAFLRDIYARLPEFPEKVVLAKLRILIRRGVLSGCGCGCRGDFEIEVKPA